MKLLQRHQKLVAGIALALLVNAIVGYLLHRGVSFMYGLQTYVDDGLMRTSAQVPDPRIIIVAIDDQSLQDYGRLGSWDRAHYADLIRFLKSAGARVAAFDMFLDPPAAGDNLVADAIGFAQSTSGGTLPMQVILAAPGDVLKDKAAGDGLVYDEFLSPSQALLGASPQLANVTLDPDGAIVRHVPLRATAGEQHSFLLPFVAVNAFLRRPSLDQEAKLRSDGILFTNRLVPTDSAYRMLINFEGPPFTFPHYSLSKVVAKEVPAARFRDKLVFVGKMGGTGLADDYPVPTSSGLKMAGVEIMANGAQNILNGKFVVPQGELTTILFMLGLSVIAAAGFFIWGAAGWAVTLAIVVLYSVSTYLWTVRSLSSAPTASQIIPLPNMAYINGDVLLTSAALFVCFFIFEQRSRHAINQMFGKYVTPEVAKLLMERQEEGVLTLGGDRRTATIMFGDIRGFTTLSEGMEPEEVMGMLNRYFDGMVDIIMAHGGTISKFIGDNVMVMFNLPMESEENHALEAARAGFEIQEWIQEYRATHPEEKAAFGFGISSGELVAGNMGSHERMEYTVIGDPVREADELCATAAANEVAISETTFALLEGAGVHVEDKGMVTIKGKTEEIHMYTVVGFDEQEENEDEAA